jgi:ppGpp synthetase/RelA/SpoT-type nucleotidyltranferase
VESRTKGPESFARKASRPERVYRDPIREMDDLCGVRVIVRYRSEVDEVARVLDDEFNVVETEDKRAKFRPDQLGYASIHKIVMFRTTDRVLGDFGKHGDVRAEIQVRTILEHAWAAISHELDYKASEIAPQELQRDLNLLSGLLELADQRFEGLRRQYAEIRRETGDKLSAGESVGALDTVRLDEFVRHSATADEILRVASHAGVRVVRDTGMDELHAPGLIRVCAALGLRGLDAVEDALKPALPHAVRFFDTVVGNLAANGTVAFIVDPTFAVAMLLAGAHFRRLRVGGVDFEELFGRSVLRAVQAASSTLLE